MEGFAKRSKRQPVTYDVFCDRRFSTTLEEPVGVFPKAVGTRPLLIHELLGWLSPYDTLQVGGIGEKANIRSPGSGAFIDIVRRWIATLLTVVGGSTLASVQLRHLVRCRLDD
jgi:hypothetical protein